MILCHPLIRQDDESKPPWVSSGAQTSLCSQEVALREEAFGTQILPLALSLASYLHFFLKRDETTPEGTDILGL